MKGERKRGKVRKIMKKAKKAEEFKPISKRKALKITSNVGSRVQGRANMPLNKMPLSKWERKFVYAFISCNGKVSKMKEKFGFSKSTHFYEALRNPRIRKGIEDCYNEAGLSLSIVFSEMKKILMKNGDSKTDSNKLKTIELLSKMKGWYAPEKKSVEKKILKYDRTDLNVLVKGLSKSFAEYEDEERKIEKIIEVKKT